MEYKIVKPNKDRIEDILDLCEGHAAFEKSEYDRSGKAERLSKDMFGEEPKLFCLVAEFDDKYVRYITWMRQDSTWDAMEYLYMDCLYLEDECRGYGIGEALVNRMKDFGRDHNINLVQWQTPDFNVRAIKFYRRVGATSLSKERFFLTI